MKDLNGKNYVELNDKRCMNHPNEDVISRERKEPKRLRNQNQVTNNKQLRPNQKLLKMKIMN